MKSINWLDQIQHEARAHGLGPNRRRWSAMSSGLLVPPGAGLAMPTCERCGGAPVHAFNIEDSNRTRLEVVGHHLHHGTPMPPDGEQHRWTNDETDYFRIDFDFPPSVDDVRRALRSAVLFRSEHFENVARKS